jgi:hypothetical protein
MVITRPENSFLSSPDVFVVFFEGGVLASWLCKDFIQRSNRVLNWMKNVFAFLVLFILLFLYFWLFVWIIKSFIAFVQAPPPPLYIFLTFCFNGRPFGNRNSTLMLRCLGAVSETVVLWPSWWTRQLVSSLRSRKIPHAVISSSFYALIRRPYKKEKILLLLFIFFLFSLPFAGLSLARVCCFVCSQPFPDMKTYHIIYKEQQQRQRMM